MALSQEDAQEFRESANLLSADELRAQLGDDPELDAIINDVLANGKAVEMKTPADTDSDDDHPNPDDVRKDQPRHVNVGDDDDDDDDDLGDQGDAAAAAAAQAAAAAAADQGDAGTIDAGTHGAQVQELPPLDLSFLDTEYKQRLADLNAQKADKFNEMMEGVITPQAYAEYEAGYYDKRDQLQVDKREEAVYIQGIHEFKGKALGDGINYDADPEKLQAWDDWVKRLASNPANANKSDAEILAMAHKKVMAEFDITPAAAAQSAKAGTKTVADGKKVAEKQGRAPKLDNIPPTLGGIPAAASSDGQDGGEFAHLDNLTGMDYERAVARLTPEQRDRYGAM